MLWHRLVSDPCLLDIAEQYVGPDIALFQTHWIAKPPRDGMPVLYHQDGAYWETERGWGGGRDPMITIRVIADDEDESNGCMKVPDCLRCLAHASPCADLPHHPPSL